MRSHPIPEVGLPDPERDTSPICEEVDEFDDTGLEGGAHGGVCHFNGRVFTVGDYVRSGNELLHCEGRGVWIRSGELRPR